MKFYTMKVGLILLLTSMPALSQNYMIERSVGFPDFAYMESAKTYNGPVFVLKDDYPESEPLLDPEVREILSLDFKEDPMAYILAARNYVFKGNIHGDDVADDFILQNNSEDKQWYHVPWQHWGPNGREGYHGLTREGPLNPYVLDPKQSLKSSAYAVGFYNGPGGYTIGRVWPSPDQGPDLDHMIEAMDDGFAFPEGTVVGKFLFTSLGQTQVPWLKNPLQWEAYVYACDLDGLHGCPRGSDLAKQPRVAHAVNLLQMDIMVKDSRASESGGWVFGTFTYNGNESPSSEYAQQYTSACTEISGDGKKWCNLMPVGLMWGNDPDNAESFVNKTSKETIINIDLEQTWINADPLMPAMHLGFNSRLNGPADNPTSSCMSCHSTSQVPSISAIMPWLQNNPIEIPKNNSTASADWMRWFRNFADGEAFDSGKAISMDFSLQLARSVENYMNYRSQAQKGRFALEYWGETESRSISRGGE